MGWQNLRDMQAVGIGRRREDGARWTLDSFLQSETLRAPARAWLEVDTEEPRLRWVDAFELMMRDPGWLAPGETPDRRLPGGEVLAIYERDDDGILEAFTGLAGADPDRFLAFANRYGALELCEHGLPHMHPPFHGAVPGPAESKGLCGPFGFSEADGDGPFTGIAPLDRWRGYAHEVQAAMRIAAALYQDTPASRDDWQRVFYGMGSGHRTIQPDGDAGALKWRGDLDDERFWFAHVLDQWLALAGVRVAYRWPKGSRGPEVHVRAGTVYGAVVRELVFLVSRVDGFAVCAACGRPFVPTRKPRSSERSYCDQQTCKTARYRHSKRDRRAGKPAKRSSPTEETNHGEPEEE